MALARKESQRLNHNFIGTEHMLLGLVQETGGMASEVLAHFGVGLDRARSEIEKQVPPGMKPVTARQLPFTPRARRVLELAMQVANDLGYEHIETPHLLLGQLRDEESAAGTLLRNLGLDLDAVREEILRRMAHAGP